LEPLHYIVQALRICLCVPQSKLLLPTLLWFVNLLAVAHSESISVDDTDEDTVSLPSCDCNLGPMH
jgi:hypothetical protein